MQQGANTINQMKTKIIARIFFIVCYRVLLVVVLHIKFYIAIVLFKLFFVKRIVASNKLKIINDPVYGFVKIPFDLIFDLLQHRYFQRLRGIKQLA